MQNTFPFVDSLITDLLAGPGYTDLSAEDRKAMAKKLEQHVQGLILESFVNRLSEEQAAELKGHMDTPDVLEEKFTEFAASVPGLAEDIEVRLKREFEVLKALGA